jgi:hypothetical protein
MNRRLALFIAAFALLSARRAAAQLESTSVGYAGLPRAAGAATESPTGINLAEGVLMHVGVGAEAGYDTNVFYGSSSVPGAVIGSAILRTTGYGEITNANRSGQGVPGLSYDVRAGLTYRHYFSNDANVKRFANAFMPSAGVSFGTNAGPWSFGLSDTFLRQEDPPYATTGASVTSASPIARDNNLATVQAQWSPGGGRITGTLRYTNSLDIFEQGSNYSFANSVSHTFTLDVSWKWLPKTALFVQGNQGYVSYLSTDTNGKVPSYPLRVIAGLRGLVTPRVTAIVALGYVNAFYSSGATTSGFLGSTYVDLQGILTPTLLSRITLGYHQDFQNSVISNFYYQYSLYASWVQEIAGRLAFNLSGRYSHLTYEGLLFDNTGQSRTDNTVIGGASLDYFIRNWIYAGVGYAITANLSDYHLPDPMTGMPNPNAPVDYVKQQVFARLGLTY